MRVTGSHSGTRGPWTRGWILLAAWSLFEQPKSPQPYPLWVLAQGLLAVLLHWTLVGFLFGYFFPYIRDSVQPSLKSALAALSLLLPLVA